MAEGGGNASKHDCSICLSSFQIPKILPCFHTFCLQCLDEYVIRNGKDGKFECPLCRACTEIPMGGVKSFQSNFYIQGGNTSDEKIDCEICGEGHEATHYCTDCEEDFCERCTTSHMKMKMSREHTLLQLKELSEKDGKYPRKLQKQYFCLQHKREEVKMICKDCDTKLCVVCKLTEHENHNTSSITKEAEEKRALLLSTIASAKKHLTSLKRKDNIANHLATVMDKELETNIVLLEKRVDSVIAEVRKEADTIKQKLVKSNTKAKDYYLEKGKLVQGKIMESEAVLHHAQNVVELGDDSQVLDRKLLVKLESLTLKDECLIKHQEHFSFETSSSNIAVDFLGKTFILGSSVIVTEHCELSFQPGNTENSNAISIDAGRLHAAFTDWYSFLCHGPEFSKTYYKGKIYSTGTCAGLTSIGGDLYFTSLCDKTVCKLKTPEGIKTIFNLVEDYPHGIAYRYCRNNNKKHELLICCLKSDKLIDMDASEGCVIAVSVADRKQYTWRDKEMPGPTCIATNVIDGTVCLGYPAAHKVTLNAPDGTVLSVYSGEGWHGNPKVFCPVSVCFDSQRFIVIVDYNNGTVIRIDMFGNFLQCLVKETTPLSVLLDDNILYVGFKGKSITRYQLKPDK